MISSVDLSFQAMLFDSLEIVKQRKSQASRLRDRVPLDLVIRGFIVKGLVPAPLRGLGYIYIYLCIHAYMYIYGSGYTPVIRYTSSKLFSEHILSIQVLIL